LPMDRPSNVGDFSEITHRPEQRREPMGIPVAHFISSYLFITGSWIYTQLVNMKRYSPFVITRQLENLGEFPFDAVYCHSRRFGANSFLQRASNKVYEIIFRSYERYCIRMIRDKGAKLLHAHFGTEGYYHLAVQRAIDIPMITTFYGADMSRLPYENPKWRRRYKKLFAEGSLFLAEGPFMAKALVDLGCSPDKVRVQHLGVDVNRIPFLPRLLKNGEPVRILMAASFREKKGIPYGISAFAKALKKFPDMELRIIGGAKTTEENEFMMSCRKLAENEGIADKVFFLGYLLYSDYLKETEAAHIFLAPSVRASNGDTEGGAPVAVIEASAAGMPVVATRHCDIPNVIIDGETGLLVAERDADALADAILKMASAPESWGSFGAAGRRRVEKEFDVFKQVARLENIYDEVVKLCF
jgi:colanic acid/amylovoran biosynthesis glycosyltransferase